MTRANARELALHLIYSWEFTGDDPDQVIKQRLEEEYYKGLSQENEVYTDRPTRRQEGYLNAVVSGVSRNQAQLNETIAAYAIGWDIKRISRLARCVMELALFEIENLEDVPAGVAVSEAVRLAKKYDGDDTGAFVNGILGAYLRAKTPAQPKAEEE